MHSYFRLILQTNLLCLCLYGCGPGENRSTVKAFATAEPATATPLSQKLARTAQPHAIDLVTLTSGKYLFDHYMVTVTFDPMSPRDFDHLKRLYGGWSKSTSQVRYRAGARYNLEDFLPPLIQALHGRHFRAEQSTLPTQEESSQLTATTLSNCWNASYEILRQAHDADLSFSAFYAHDTAMQAFLLDVSYSRSIKPFSKNAEQFQDPVTRNQDLQPGDLVLVGDRWLYHVAIFIDNDLYFEKSGSSDATLYRFVTYDMLAKTWSPTLYGWSYRRFDRNSLPDAMSLFGAKATLPDDQKVKSITEPAQSNISVIRELRGDNWHYFFFLRKQWSWQVDESTFRAYFPSLPNPPDSFL